MFLEQRLYSLLCRTFELGLRAFLGNWVRYL